MPGRRAERSIDDGLCRRCQAVEPSITVRTEPLCEACFSRYVHSKVIKRMESFRVRHAEPGQARKLLLPVAFDACSIALLHILSHQLKYQSEKTGRTGFRLCVVHVREDSLSSRSQDDKQTLLDQLQADYPEHEYHSLQLSDVLAIEGASDLLAYAPAAAEGDNSQGLQHILRSLNSATSRADMQSLLERKLIVYFAKTHTCEAILWSDSTTKLAERTLAETAKGRGFSLPWVVADGPSPYGMSFYHPLQDLLNNEIETFVSLIKPSVKHLVFGATIKPAVSTKNTSIDELMAQYVAGVEQEYPAIVTNVVKTTGKLQAPSIRDIEQHCELCEMPLDGQAPARSRLCYGCIRTLPQASAG